MKARGPILAAALCLAQAQAVADDAAEGRAIAERWCAGCHLVSDDQIRANPDVPGFAAIAAKYRAAGDFAPMRTFLVSPHPPMPDMSLTRGEIRALSAYIESLAP